MTTAAKTPRLTFHKNALRDFLVQVLGQGRVLKKLYPGIMHFMIFWGVAIQVVGTIINIMNMMLFLPFVITFPRDNWYLAYEVAMDVAGVFIILGVLMAVFRRLVLRPKYLSTNWDDWFALGMLLLIALIGFTNEAMRLIAASPPWAGYSLVGRLVCRPLPLARHDGGVGCRMAQHPGGRARGRGAHAGGIRAVHQAAPHAEWTAQHPRPPVASHRRAG